MNWLLRMLVPLLLSTWAAVAISAPKVLLIGVDGAQYEKIQALNLPNFSRLKLAKAYTGGVVNTGTEQVTNSAPSWATILTGVWVNKHGVTDNSDTQANEEQFPSIFKRIRDVRPNAYIASVTHWGAINKEIFPKDVAASVNYRAEDLTDQEVTNKTIELIKTTPADFIFVHLDDVDHEGHSYGFYLGGKYTQSLRNTDARIGQLLDAVSEKVKTTGDDWLVLAVTDHGRDETLGFNHGSQTTYERTTWIASNRPELMNTEFNQLITNPSNTAFNGQYGNVPLTWVAPTVLRHLGIEPKAEWQLDGAPLIGNEAVRKLMPVIDANYTFSWLSYSGGSVHILRDGQFISTVPAQQGRFTDLTATPGLHNYTVVQNGTPVSVRIGNKILRAALDWNASLSYFFFADGSYVRYNQSLDKADTDYPKEINETTWPGLSAYRDLIVGSFSKDSSKAYFFLSDGRYLRYDKSSDRVDSGYPKLIDDNSWPGLGKYAQQIAATLRWSGGKVFFFLKDGTYIRYDLWSDSADTGYPKKIDDNTWPGVGKFATQIQAAYKWDDFRAYFFLKNGQYIKYNIASDAAESGYPRSVAPTNWPGLAE